MAAKKKTKKKTKLAKSTRKKAAPAKKLAKRKPAPRKKLATTEKKRKTASKPASAKKAVVRKKPVARKAPRAGKAQNDNMVAFPRQGARARSGGQSGDLQGLSDIERSNSESVDELLEEGNTFEAEAVRGVEEAGNAEEKEVRTHEVPEDDVPGEYLDKD
ncbi:MAG TPA: hypothetical protein VNW47_04895 [Terriglobales bacterium]|jgi:hypothetical protein|nr:hypothetical protein [Terriglobales bacterium]